MDGVLVAVGAELLQFDAARRVATVLLGGVARYTVRALVRVSPAFSALKGNDEADAFSHDNSPRVVRMEVKTQSFIIPRQADKCQDRIS